MNWEWEEEKERKNLKGKVKLCKEWLGPCFAKTHFLNTSTEKQWTQLVMFKTKYWSESIDIEKKINSKGEKKSERQKYI